MTDIRPYVEAIQYRYKNHRYQTDNFTWDYLKATDEEVLNTTGIFSHTIDGLSGLIMQITLPKHRTRLRREIAYLIGLRQRQAEAWERYIADCEARANNVNQWVIANCQ